MPTTDTYSTSNRKSTKHERNSGGTIGIPQRSVEGTPEYRQIKQILYFISNWKGRKHLVGCREQMHSNLSRYQTWIDHGIGPRPILLQYGSGTQNGHDTAANAEQKTDWYNVDGVHLHIQVDSHSHQPKHTMQPAQNQTKNQTITQHWTKSPWWPAQLCRNKTSICYANIFYWPCKPNT